MGTAALTLGGVRRGARTRAATADRCLAFDRLGGPVVAVCGLAGGVGATTIALALAHRAAIESRVPVLVADNAGATGGLARLADAASPLSLAGLARLVADGAEPDRVFAELPSGLRLVATGPGNDGTAAPADTRAIVSQAREAHGLVVLDCGTRWLDDAAALDDADTVVWTMAATEAGLRGAPATLARRHSAARTVLVAREFAGVARPSVRSLRALAAQGCERLVLWPDDARIADRPDAHELLEPVLAAIGPILQRGGAR